MSFQEKFQIILPPKPDEDDGTEWKTFESQRRTFEPGRYHVNNETSGEDVDGKYNEMPPNMQLVNQNVVERNLAGSSDAAHDTNPESCREGFTRGDLKGDDDQYTGEHVDHFYGIVYGRDNKEKLVEGFAERNNYLDRL